MPVYTGSAAEQWTQAGIDVALGRITVEELHELGVELFRGDKTEQSLLVEIEKLENEIEELRGYEDEADKLEDEVKELKREIKSLEITIRTLESRSRPEGYES